MSLPMQQPQQPPQKHARYADAYISNDYYWGIGVDGSGKNMLGKLLMEVRQALSNTAKHNHP
jgi:hypothetical protein